MNSVKNCIGQPSATQRGVSLIEVLVAIIVFAVGLLAIASLQGQLLRSASDAKARSAAVNLAEEKLEQMRAFRELLDEDGDPSNDFDAIQTDSTGETIEKSGVEFTRSWSVENYYYDPSTPSAGASQTVPSPTPAFPDFKLVQIDVSWTDESGDVQQVKVEDIIAASPPADSAQAFTGVSASDPPVVRYRPGAAPEIISVDLADDTLKETQRPEPEVQTEQSTITTFEAITYSNQTIDGFPSQFRREEFLTVNCRCQQEGTPATEENFGRAPTSWVGPTESYVLGEKVSKPVGSNPDPNQTFLCDRCCRDHHDDVAGTYDHDGNPNTPEVSVEFDPFRPEGDDPNGNPYFLANGDHSHFGIDPDTGNLIPRNNSGDQYLEACRFIRLDGRFRVARDFHLDDLQTLPQSYLQTDSGVSNFRGYVSKFAEDYVNHVLSNSLGTAYPQTTPDPDNAATPFSADFEGFRSNLPTSTVPPFNEGNSNKQLVARGVYMDYMDPVLVNALKCRSSSHSGTNCEQLGIEEGPVLPWVPFFEVNLTRLAVWGAWPESPSSPDADGNRFPDRDGASNSITVTKEALTSRNEDSYSRGRISETDTCKAKLNNSQGCENAFVWSAMQLSNTGVSVNENPIDKQDENTIDDALLIDFEALTPDRGILITGDFSRHNNVNQVSLSSIEIEGGAGVFCTSNTDPAGYTCELDDGVTGGRVTIGGYNQGQDNQGNTINHILCPLAGLVFEDTTTGTRVENIGVSQDGTGDETTTYEFTNLTDSGFTLDIKVVLNSSNCPN